ncbi:MAG: cell envelope integrity protein CreD [Terracidiphilus sp.]
MGLKLIAVCALALSMCIPALFVFALVLDRTSREGKVVKEVGSTVGGRQTFLGPTLAIPYDIPPQGPAGSGHRGIYIVFPAAASATVKTSTEERHRSLFRVPVFQADLKMDASFDLTGAPAAAPEGAVLDWSHAEIVVGVSDARGALADALLDVNGKTATMAPAEVSQRIAIGGEQGPPLNLTLFGADAGDLAKPGARFDATATLRFSGAQRIALLAYGKTTRVHMQGDWPNPGFDGGFLPASRTVSASGFSADWLVPFIARGVRAEGPSDSVTALGATALGVSFVEMADPYQSVSRSLKYVPLFLGLIFLSYFIFEVSTRKRVHLAQYILVGVAQIIFYLLLLSFAERIGFDLGFLLGGAATVLLLAANARWVFASRTQGVRALAIFTLLYGLIYMLLRLEDNALLVGAIASFLAVAAAMYFTRGIDWYSSLPGDGAGQQGDSTPGASN